jgi:hypothetical protein
MLKRFSILAIFSFFLITSYVQAVPYGAHLVQESKPWNGQLYPKLNVNNTPAHHELIHEIQMVDGKQAKVIEILPGIGVRLGMLEVSTQPVKGGSAITFGHDLSPDKAQIYYEDIREAFEHILAKPGGQAFVKHIIQSEPLGNPAIVKFVDPNGQPTPLKIIIGYPGNKLDFTATIRYFAPGPFSRAEGTGAVISYDPRLLIGTRNEAGQLFANGPVHALGHELLHAKHMIDGAHPPRLELKKLSFSVTPVHADNVIGIERLNLDIEEIVTHGGKEGLFALYADNRQSSHRRDAYYNMFGDTGPVNPFYGEKQVVEQAESIQQEIHRKYQEQHGRNPERLVIDDVVDARKAGASLNEIRLIKIFNLPYRYQYRLNSDKYTYGKQPAYAVTSRIRELSSTDLMNPDQSNRLIRERFTPSTCSTSSAPFICIDEISEEAPYGSRISERVKKSYRGEPHGVLGHDNRPYRFIPRAEEPVDDSQAALHLLNAKMQQKLIQEFTEYLAKDKKFVESLPTFGKNGKPTEGQLQILTEQISPKVAEFTKARFSTGNLHNALSLVDSMYWVEDMIKTLWSPEVTDLDKAALSLSLVPFVGQAVNAIASAARQDAVGTIVNSILLQAIPASIAFPPLGVALGIAGTLYTMISRASEFSEKHAADIKRQEAVCKNHVYPWACLNSIRRYPSLVL